MTTKAEVLSGIEAVSKAVQAVALVASNLKEVVATVGPEISFLETTDGSIVISSPTIKEVSWTYVSNTPPSFPWYGGMTKVKLPVAIKPVYIQSGDFIKVQYGDKYIDGPKTTPTVPAQPVTSSGPRAFVKNMTVNVNVERMRPTYMKYQGSLLTQQPYYTYLASKGITGVRMFIPYRADRDMGLGTGVPAVAAWDGILDAAQAAMMAGLQVMCGCTDVVGEGIIKYDDWKAHADNVAKRVAERGFDPNKFALEVANELAGNDNNFWNDMRTGVHDVIRKRLPNHTIIHGCSGWNGITGWNNSWKMPSDKNIIMQFHDYGFHSVEDWSQLEVFLTDFARSYDVSIINGEQGDDFQHVDVANMSRWCDNFRNMARGAGILRPCPWTVTDGGAFRLNRDSVDPTLHATFEAALPELIAIVKAIPGWGV